MFVLCFDGRIFAKKVLKVIMLQSLPCRINCSVMVMINFWQAVERMVLFDFGLLGQVDLANKL